MDLLFHVISISFYFLGYFLFAYSIFRNESLHLSYSLGILVFLTLQYGPHTVIFTDMLRLSIYADSEFVNQIYNFMMGFVFFVFAVLLLILPGRAVIGGEINEVKDFSYEGLLKYRKRFAWALFFIFLVSFLLQGGGKIALEHLQFMFGSSFFSYKEIRREMFADSLWSKFADLIRFSIVPVIYSYFLILGLVSKVYKVKVFYIAISVFFVIFSVIQLNKFFFLYYSVLSLIIVFSLNKLEWGMIKSSTMLKALPLFIIGMLLFLLLILSLYRFQYSQALDQGLIDFEDIVNTLFFRVFFASSDSLRLWIDYFGVSEQYQGFNIIGKICNLFGSCFNPNTFIPYHYLGRELTSMQAGFLGTALGFGGFFAIPFVSVLVVSVIAFNNCVLNSIRSGYLLIAFSPIMLINSFFLTTREFHTALLSGGAIFTALFIIMIINRFKV
mgnify:CR=1 FL=1